MPGGNKLGQWGYHAIQFNVGRLAPGVVLLASFLPGRRATQLDPVAVLRGE